MVKVILTGATGTAGAEILRQLLLHPSIESVAVLSRRPLPAHIAPNPPSPKLRVILHDDFGVYSEELLGELAGYDAAIWAMGKMPAWGNTEEGIIQVEFTWPLAAARAFATLIPSRTDVASPKFVFAHLSGSMVTQDEAKAPMFIGKIKGRAELALAKLRDEFPSSLATYSLRPAGIFPTAPTPESTWVQSVGTLFGPLMRWYSPALVIDADVLGRGMVEVVLRGSGGEIEGLPVGKGRAGNEATVSSDEIKLLAGQSVLAVGR